jgi:hypothetical protein
MHRTAQPYCSLIAFAAALLLSPRLPAQAVLSGSVRDSLTGRTFANALVELVPTNRPWLAGFSARTDSAGKFVIADVTPGTYHFGFQHPRLDSLGMDPVLRTLEVADSRRRMMADLALPTARTIARTLCGDLGENSGALVGRVIDARDGNSVPRGTVRVRWGELNVSKQSVGITQRQREVMVSESGRFVVCGVPTDGPIDVRATALDGSGVPSPLSSGTIELAFAYDATTYHRDLFVGPETRVSLPQATRTESESEPVTARRGQGRLTARVLSDEGRAIAGARIIVPDAAIEVVTDSAGSVRLSNLPLGSYAVDMLALGYLPMRLNVDISAAQGAAVEFSAARRVPTLTAVTVRDRQTDPTGFWNRRASGKGYFVDANQIRSWGAPSLASALAMAPVLRGNLQGRANCSPVIFVDAVRFDNAPFGQMLSGLDIGGVEVYGNPADVPPQFSNAGRRPSGSVLCATIVVWTKAYVY